MATTLNMTLLLRRAAFADTCVLALGEPGYHTTTKEFKIGDGTSTWAALPIANKTQIEAIVNAAIAAHAAGYYTKEEINAIKKALEDKDAELLVKINENAGAITAEAQAREAADTQIRTDFAAADASTLAEAKGYADTKKAEVIGDANSTKDSDTVKGAKLFASDVAATAKSEAISAAATDAASKANAAEAAAKTYAEAQASAAQSAAIAEAESKDEARATAAATNLANAVSALETKISSGDSATLASAKEYTDEQVAAEAKLRSDADAALDERLEKIEVFFEGADHDGEDGGLKDALDTLVEIQNYIEAEGGAADEMVKDIAQNASDIDALEGRMGTAESTITSLGTNKLDKSTYEDYIADKEMSDAQLKKYAEDEADAAQSAAEAKAAELDAALHTEISKEIDADVKAAIDAEIERANGAYDAKGDAATAESNAKNYADAQDTALATTLKGTKADGDTTAETIRGAKDYADKVATAAQSAAAADATSKANTAESNAKTYADTEIGKEKTRAEGQEAAIRNEFAAADVTTLTSAQTYADTVAANTVKNNIKAGDNDIVISHPESGDDAGKTVISHKVYGTGTYTKPDAVNDANFVTGVTIENGHVTGASVKSLAEALAAMSFIFDGGTAADTITNN